MARRARDLAHELGVPFPRDVALRLGVTPLDVRDGPLVLRRVGPHPSVAVAVADVDRLPGSQHGEVLDLRCQVAERRRHREVLGLRQACEQVLEVAGDRGRRPYRDGVLRQAHRRVGNHQLGIDLEHRAQPRADGAGAPRAVERELPRLELLDRDVVVVGARQFLRVAPFPVLAGLRLVDEVDRHDALGEPQSGLHRVGEPLLHGRLDGEPVDDHVDRVLALLVERGRLRELVDLAVHPDAGETFGGQLSEQLVVLALPSPDDRRQNLEAGSLGESEQPVDDLLRRLPTDRLATLRAVRPSSPGEQETEVVVHLRDRADGRAGVARGGLLVDRHRRREALDEVDSRLVHLADELPGVRRQRLHVASLALGEDRVERQRRLAGTGQTREHDQGVARQVERHILEVVLPGASDNESVHHAGHRTGAHRQFTSADLEAVVPRAVWGP